jgi:S-adenosylmethionine:tRNA ribosyltransferase-isomerase
VTAAPATHFSRPDDRTAAEPPEHRGVARDGIRLLVARPQGIVHTRFHDLDRQLTAGDLLVVNTSRTRAAEIDGYRFGSEPIIVHCATELDDRTWVVELRAAPTADRAVLDAAAGEVIRLPGASRLRLLEPYPRSGGSPTGHGTRLWRAQLIGTTALPALLAQLGRPISYGYLSGSWPLSDYQTIFARDDGSAEMPSAARPFSYELLARLVTAGIVITPITLHTGVSSQEAGEPPQPERYSVPESTARLVALTRAAGRRVIAVGTTATRALESATDDSGTVRAAAGWTDVVLSPQRPVRVVSGLITGLHDPEASHLLLVEAVAGAELAQRAYDAAVSQGYLWHEFGDSCLLLP